MKNEREPSPVEPPPVTSIGYVSTSLPCRWPQVQTPTGPTLRVLRVAFRKYRPTVGTS